MDAVATITPIRGYRLNNTPTRWQRALRRALAEGVAVRQLATSGVWVASSGTDATVAYVVTEHDCECRAAQEGDVCCKHRAILRFTVGTLTLDPEPQPPAPAAPALDPADAADAYGRGFAAGARTNYGLVARTHADMAGWERTADPRVLAYRRGIVDGLATVGAPAAA